MKQATSSGLIEAAVSSAGERSPSANASCQVMAVTGSSPISARGSMNNSVLTLGARLTAGISRLARLPPAQITIFASAWLRMYS